MDSLAVAVDTSAESGRPFRLSSVTDFAWDRVHVVPPYTSAEGVNSELGFRWDEAEEAAPKTDWIYLIVFVNDGKVTRAFQHDVEGGNLGCLTYPTVRRGGLSRERARLQARRVRLSPSDTYDRVCLARP